VNLGLPRWLMEPIVEQGAIQKCISWLSPLALPVEVPFFWFWTNLPAEIRYMVIMIAWKIWLAVHKAVPVLARGASDELSMEGHALNNVLFWFRLIPLTTRRMRFSLNQLDSSRPVSRDLRVEAINLPERGVHGSYLHTGEGGEGGASVIFWIFGGAFVGGSIRGSMGFAEQYGRQARCDVFMIDMRLYPEHPIEDAYVDACRGYEWLLTRTAPEKVVVYGLSSGGGVALRLLQMAASNDGNNGTAFSTSASIPQPAGAVLCGAWIRYTTPTRSMKEFPVVDLVVTQRVYEFIFPQLGDMCGGEERRRAVSPLYNDMKGLCPLYISVSKHEVCIDENRELAQKAKDAGVQVTVDEVPYLPHAFQWCTSFVPEAQESDKRILRWMESTLGKKKSQ